MWRLVLAFLAIGFVLSGDAVSVTLITDRLASFVGIESDDPTLPCKKHPGPAKEWEIARCNGNYIHSVNVGFGLTNNSMYSYLDYGFGPGWVPEFEIELLVNNGDDKATVIYSDGSMVEYVLSTGDPVKKAYDRSELSFVEADQKYHISVPGGEKMVFTEVGDLAVGKLFTISEVVNRYGKKTTFHRDTAADFVLTKVSYPDGLELSFVRESGLVTKSPSCKDH